MSPKIDHQVKELTKAFSDLINTERIKAKLDAFSIIKDGQEAGKTPQDILVELLRWVREG